MKKKGVGGDQLSSSLYILCIELLINWVCFFLNMFSVIRTDYCIYIDICTKTEQRLVFILKFETLFTYAHGDDVFHRIPLAQEFLFVVLTFIILIF